MRGLVLVAVGLLIAFSASAREIEFGVGGTTGSDGTPGVTALFLGKTAPGAWIGGGYGGGLYSSGVQWAGGGLLLGVRPIAPLSLTVRLGAGAGFYRQQAGAVGQTGLDLSLAGPWNLVLAASWDRIRNLYRVPALPGRGIDVWSVGLRLRVPVRN